MTRRRQGKSIKLTKSGPEDFTREGGAKQHLKVANKNMDVIVCTRCPVSCFPPICPTRGAESVSSLTWHKQGAVRVLLCVWLPDALSSKRVTKPYSEPIQTILGNDRNRTQSILRQDMFPFLDHGAHKKNALKIGTVPFSNRMRNICDFAQLSTTLFCFGVLDCIAHSPHGVSNLHTVWRDLTVETCKTVVARVGCTPGGSCDNTPSKKGS